MNPPKKKKDQREMHSPDFDEIIKALFSVPPKENLEIKNKAYREREKMTNSKLYKSIGIALFVLFSTIPNAHAQAELVVTDVMQGKIIWVSGMKFKAKGICTVDKGDIIVFPGATHNCHTTVFYNKSKGNTCEVYCGHR